MDIKQYSEGGTRIFELTLNKEDIKGLSDSDYQGVVSPYAPNEARFQLFPHPNLFSGAFQILPADPSVYYAYVGDLGIRSYKDLENLINSRDRIPIEMPSSVPDGNPINLGYVVLKVAWERQLKLNRMMLGRALLWTKWTRSVEV